MDYSDPNCFTYPFQLTPSIHRDVYPYLDPTRAELSAQGKTVLITGVAGGVGKVSKGFDLDQWPTHNSPFVSYTPMSYKKGLALHIIVFET